jgi:hypothetical protein
MKKRAQKQTIRAVMSRNNVQTFQNAAMRRAETCMIEEEDTWHGSKGSMKCKANFFPQD